MRPSAAFAWVIWHIRRRTRGGLGNISPRGERDVFLHKAERVGRQVCTLCMMLAYAGCLLSEAQALTVDRVDLATGVLVLSLQKRHTGIYRAVPMRPRLFEALDLVHGICEQHGRRGKGRGERLWFRMIGWCAVQAVELGGPRASPKGLRHGWAGSSEWLAVHVGIRT